MNWDDIDDILYDGTKEEIRQVKCPDCGGEISYRYDTETRSFEVSCKTCGHYSKATNSDVPNCVKYFGEKVA